MAYLLRFLIFVMLCAILLTVSLAHHWLQLPLGHIQVAILAFLYAIFAQAFVMFYFIGVSKFVVNIYNILHRREGLDAIFDSAPADLTPYIKKVEQFKFQAETCKRQTVPWAVLTLLLGMLAFLLGGAHDTGLVAKTTHSGVVYGLLVAMGIGFVRQWIYLGKAHQLLRAIKALFTLPDHSM